MILADLLRGSVATALVTLPGWLVARSWRVPLPVLAGFVGGTVALTNVILTLDALQVRFSTASVGGAWLSVTLAAAVVARKKTAPLDAAASVPPTLAWREHWPLLVPLAPALAVVAFRAIAQPLSGIDTVFRWNWLAQQMLAHGSLNFYPPVSGADYEIYAWPDGIAPAVSGLYFWSYQLAGAARPVLTAPLVLAQFVLLVAAAFALARRMFSERAAAFGIALLACSPLVLWGTAMGQETGLTALALTAMLLWLPRSRAGENLPAMVAAGLAAGLGALAREYGLAWPLLGLAIGLGRRLSPRALLAFVAAAGVGAAPWYARNWWRTKNPLFDLDLGGWFPVNEAHAWIVQAYQPEFGWSHLPPEAPRLLVTNALAGLLGLAAGALLRVRPDRALLAAAGVIAAIWIISLGYTAAGFIYALRVLSPALVLGAVLGGAALARWLPGQRHRTGAAFALALFATDSALRALTLPANVYRLPTSEWLTTGRVARDFDNQPLYGELARVAGSARILVLGPNAQLTALGMRTVPLWSPEVRFLFEAGATPEATARRLRAAGIGFVFLTKGPANERYLARSAFFRDPAGTLRALWSGDDQILLKIADAPRK